MNKSNETRMNCECNGDSELTKDDKNAFKGGHNSYVRQINTELGVHSALLHACVPRSRTGQIRY
jgi:hypothetical protein